VVSDVPVDDETPVVTSRISRSTGALSFRGAHRSRVCLRVFSGVSVRACCECLHLSGFSTVGNKFVSIVRQAQMVSTGDNGI
jgi:hypothetical protein